MIWLILSIISSSVIFIVFKLVAKNTVNAIQVIAINYMVCVFTGIIAAGKLNSWYSITDEKWFLPAILLGSIFIFGFYLTSLTVKYNGVSVASIAGKLSLIIPTAAAWFLYNDPFSFLKITGISIAIISIVFTSYKKKEILLAEHARFRNYIFPAAVLVISGLIDTFTKYNEAYFLDASDYNYFLVIVFATAGSIGLSALAYRRIFYRENIQVKSILYGLLLGIPNYGSMYFLIRALHSGMSSSVIFPVNNISIVLVSCFIAWVFFHEKLNKINVAGIGLAVSAIILIMLS